MSSTPQREARRSPRRLGTSFLASARLLALAAFLVALESSGGLAFGQCPSDSLMGRRCNPQDGGDSSPLNMDLNYYGGILEDADYSPTCAANAAARLTTKLDVAVAAGKHFDGFLEGSHVTLIFAAALRIGAQDKMTVALDNDLQYVRNVYLQYGGIKTVESTDPGGCGFDGVKWKNGNTCMDGYTVAADAYGWIAGYEFRAGRSPQAAIDLIDSSDATKDTAVTDAFGGKSVCIYNPNDPGSIDPNNRGICNGKVQDLGKPGVVILSFNHGFQNIAYGIGLMPLIAGAQLGMRVANSSLILEKDSNRVAIGQGIMREAQNSSESAGAHFLSNCQAYPGGPATAYCTDHVPADCDNLPAHQYGCPDMYRVNFFYTHHFNFVPNPPLFQFDKPGTRFTEDDLCSVMGIGRRVLFQTLADDWLLNTPALRGKFDGWLDTADCTAIAGWAWDSTLPNTPINVDIYDGPTLFATVAANLFRSDLASKGNGYHAFYWPLPVSLRNGATHTITVKISGTAGLPGNPGLPLGNTPRTITCAPPSYQGNFEAAGCSAISGWAWDSTLPNTPINVTITSDGTSIGTFTAGNFRADLLAAHIGNGYHGFSVATPPSLMNGVSHSIAVAYPNGAAVTGSPRFILCYAPPTITGLFPAFGPTAGGSLVTIRGTGFIAGATVRFGGLLATTVTRVDSTTLIATTPAHGAAAADVVVTNPDGQGYTSTGAFTFGGVSSYTVTPCRLIDTRGATGPYGGPALNGGADRTFVIAGHCGVPATGARAVLLNVTVASPGPTAAGQLTLYPGGTALPGTSTISYSANQTRANNATTSLGASGDIVIRCGQAAGNITNVIVDVVGYMQ